MSEEHEQEKRKLGLYDRYKPVERYDGKPVKANVFVLEYTDDEHAQVAMFYYAKSVEKEYPYLSTDILSIIQDLAPELWLREMLRLEEFDNNSKRLSALLHQSVLASNHDKFLDLLVAVRAYVKAKSSLKHILSSDHNQYEAEDAQELYGSSYKALLVLLESLKDVET